MYRTATVWVVVFVAGCGVDSGLSNEAPDCVVPAGPVAVQISQPATDEIVTENEVELRFVVTGWTLRPRGQCACLRCGELTVIAPAPDLCSVPPMTVAASPARVTIARSGGECPISTAPGPVEIGLSAMIDYVTATEVRETVRIEYRP